MGSIWRDYSHLLSLVIDLVSHNEGDKRSAFNGIIEQYRNQPLYAVQSK
jgi:hypothetical protein